mmetsp:Transcript_22451/g.38398  ORF Transcript_22451/g.38398 Transcript_22451/m.38398 type:complete len:91 (+) Transcript_22451:4221-4493(+)|eukprot:scaffold28622_cov256-Skeletonema_marinoi.AAC.1
MSGCCGCNDLLPSCLSSAVDNSLHENDDDMDGKILLLLWLLNERKALLENNATFFDTRELPKRCRCRRRRGENNIAVDMMLIRLPNYYVK